MECKRFVSVEIDTALYEINHAITIIGKPVPSPNTTGSIQFQIAGMLIAISIMVKKYTNRCGQNAMAKNIPNMNDHSQLL
jgi:hypothetical protein